MPEGDGSLSALAQRMQSLGLPSLSILIARLGEIEEYQDFLNLVKEFLPEREAEILRNITPASQMAAFASYFEDRYFPLDDNIKLGELESYYELTRGIPVICRGLSYDDYHYISTDSRDGVQLATLLIEDPYSEEGDAHIALAEACQELVPVELIRLVPEGGISAEEAHRLLNDTKYEGLALWADIVCANTGNFFLDTDYEMLWSGCELPDWCQEVVADLTREWQQADVIDEKASNFFDWLEADLEPRFRELLNFILERR